MHLRKIVGLLAVLFSLINIACAAELAGHWTAEFDSQIGVQKYAYDFTVDGDKLAGKATYEHSMGKGETPLTAIKVSGDEVSFAESLTFDGNQVAITYTGKIVGDEMKLTRQVGDFATEQIVARRTRSPAAAK